MPIAGAQSTNGTKWRFAVGKKGRRTGAGLGILLALSLLSAAPAAAVGPTRTVLTFAPGVSHYPAGTGCTFDVTAYRQDARVTVTDFSDGTEVTEAHNMHRTIVNDATGATFADNIEAHEVDRIDPATGIIRGSVNGQSIFTFAPGDVAPDGGTVDHVYSIAIFGTVSYVIDGTTFATLAITIRGSYTDICAAIS
jgi:hypothetical protein